MSSLDIIRPCFAWIPILWGEECLELFVIKRKKAIPELPFDIMTDILTRLPAKCIFKIWQNKKKSRLLYALTATPFFIRTHLNRAAPVIVVLNPSFTQLRSCSEIKLFLLNEEAKTVESTSMNLGLRYPIWKGICMGPIINLCGSYDGFLLFRSNIHHTRGPILCIWNPITKEQVIVTSKCNLFYVCAFYFHPCWKEYVVLCVCIADGQSHFQILNLRNRQRRSVGSCSHYPDYKKHPVFINGTLYWLVDDCWYYKYKKVYPGVLDLILTFNTETEELSTMEIVELSDIDASVYHLNHFQLFELEGNLCLFDSSSCIEPVIIWVSNCITKHWVKMHSLGVPGDFLHHWIFHWYFKDVMYISKKHTFLENQPDKRLISWNLRLGTWKFVEEKRFEGDDFAATVHTHSIASLHAADSVISLQS